MIEKQWTGNNPYQLIDYHEKKVEKGVGERLFSNIGFVDTKDANDQFEFIRTSSTRKITDFVFHSSINLATGENIPNEAFEGIAKSYIDQMGFGDSPYIVYRHYDEDHHHIHVITTRYTFNPTQKVSDSNSKIKANKIIAELENQYAEKYGLRKVSNKAVENQERISKDRKAGKEKTFLSKSDKEDLTLATKFIKSPKKRLKHQIRNLVVSAFENTDDPIKAVAFLKRNGIQTNFNSNSGGIYGVSFGLIKPEIRTINFSKLPTSYFGHKFSPEEVNLLQKKGKIHIDKMGEVFRSDNNMILSTDIEEQLTQAITSAQAFKGSSLDKSLSWNVLKTKLKLLSKEDEFQLAEKVRAISSDYSSADKLLLSYESGYLSGVIEALREGRRLDEIAPLTFNVGEKFWTRCQDEERRILSARRRNALRTLSVQKTPYMNLRDKLNHFLVLPNPGLKEEIIMYAYGLVPSRDRLYFMPSSLLTSQEQERIITNKTYQFVPRSFRNFEMTETDKAIIVAFRSGDKNRLERFERDKQFYRVAAIMYENVPEVRPFMREAFYNQLQQIRDRGPNLSWEANRLMHSIAEDIVNDYKDENNLRRE